MFPEVWLLGIPSESEAHIDEIQTLGINAIALRLEFEIEGAETSLCNNFPRGSLACKYWITTVLPQI